MNVINKVKTCSACVSLRKKPVLGCPVYYCDVTQDIIPHKTELINDKKYLATFWRIPLDCPLPDDFVIKSENKIPESEWVIINA